MSKSPKARSRRKARSSTTRTVVTSASLEKALRPRKPTKALVELMRHVPVWDRPLDRKHPQFKALHKLFAQMLEAHRDYGKRTAHGVLSKFGVPSIHDLKSKCYPEAIAQAERDLAGLRFSLALIAGVGERADKVAQCVWCGVHPGEPHKATCRAVAATSAVQAENDKLVQQPGAKASNPKDALGIKKVPFSTISMPVLAELGVAMLEGALKYGRHNYRAIGVRGSVYFDANVARHQALWWEGEDEDPDTCEVTTEDTGVKNGQGHFVIPGTGLHHLTKAIAGLCVIRDAMIQGKFIDDRPPRTAKGWQDRLNKIVEALLKKYPTPVAPYIEGDERMK